MKPINGGKEPIKRGKEIYFRRKGDPLKEERKPKPL
jgi:hypothetical protein